MSPHLQLVFPAKGKDQMSHLFFFVWWAHLAAL